MLLDYGEPLRLARVEIYENYNPGAVDRVTVFNAAGKEIDLPLSSKETRKSRKDVIVLSIPVDTEIDTTRLKIYLNSPAVKGWNEIDAVSMTDAAGKTHWAKEARASSTGADASPHTSLTAVPQTAELNKLGHQYLDLGRLDAAGLVFEFNGKAFPESIVAQESLSEFFRRLGNNQLAREAGVRALTLENSEQQRVRERLARGS